MDTEAIYLVRDGNWFLLGIQGYLGHQTGFRISVHPTGNFGR